MKERKRRMEMMKMMNQEREGNMHVFIKVKNIHFNPAGKLAFKSNSFLAI